ncbi:hypothetical protein [Rhizobium lentis]|uniref:Uncharacterized protein n=1 Tax=Rhizobium lentis TaxID=1138194 RepID=A0A9Q3QV86_9HYPH|nr:hypothetical protein [Rhizobium lentis]MBX5021153.1 hypothetical protein [Rhizobium lentis]
MPRIADPKNEVGRRRTAAYREAQAALGAKDTKGRPEASDVDRALAAAVAVFCCDLGHPSPEMQGIIRLAKDILKQRGFDTRETKLKIQSRILLRSDLHQLREIPRSGSSEAPAGASL